MSLLHQLQHQYSIITSEATARLAKIQRLKDVDKTKELAACKKLASQDAAELLEQMEISIRDIDDQSERLKNLKQLQHFRTDLKLLEAELKKATMDVTSDFLGFESYEEDHRAQLLTDTEKIERSNRQLEDGLRIAVETEQIGAEVLKNLDLQRSTLNDAREKLRMTDEDLSESGRVLTRMIKRVIAHRALLLFVIFFVVFIFLVIVISAVHKSKT